MRIDDRRSKGRGNFSAALRLSGGEKTGGPEILEMLESKIRVADGDTIFIV